MLQLFPVNGIQKSPLSPHTVPQEFHNMKASDVYPMRETAWLIEVVAVGHVNNPDL